MKPVEGTPPGSSDGGSGVAVTSVEEAVIGQLGPRVPGPQEGIVGDHGRVVPAGTTCSSVAHRFVENLPRRHSIVIWELSFSSPFKDSPLPKVNSPAVLKIVPKNMSVTTRSYN